MKQRSTEILQQLLRNPREGISLSYLQEKYHVSEKTLKDDIEEIANFVQDGKDGDVFSFDGHEIRLGEKTVPNRLMKRLYDMTPYMYKMSAKERRIYIIITLLGTSDYYSMQQLADELFVTRNTIINDCKDVKAYLGKYHLELIARSKKGMQIQKDDYHTCQMLIDLFFDLVPQLSSIKTFYVRFLIKKLGWFYELSDIIYYMNRFMRQTNWFLVNDVLFEMAISIFVLVNELPVLNPEDKISDKSIKKMDDAELDLLGQILKYTTGKIGWEPLSLPRLRFMEVMIIKRGLVPKKIMINDFEFYGIICHFLMKISTDLRVNFLQDDMLVKSLLSHLKSMEAWSDTEFNFAQEYLENEPFAKVMTAIDDHISILESYLPYPINQKVKNSIALHICAALLRTRKSSANIRVAICCPGIMATGKYLEAQVHNYFDFQITGTFTAKELELKAESSRHEFDFVISSVQLFECHLPVVVVSPLLTFDDINRIQLMASHIDQNISDSISMSQHLLKQLNHVYEVGNDAQIEYLNTELQKILSDVYAQKLGESVLLHMMNPEHVLLTTEPMDWRMAIRKAAEKMLQDGYFEERYVEEAIHHVELYGNYIIVSPGVAVAHAGRESGVHKDGIGLLVSRDGIEFEDGEKVYLLFIFGQKDEKEYLDLFDEIIQLGQNSRALKRIAACQTIADLETAIQNTLTHKPFHDQE